MKKTHFIVLLFALMIGAVAVTLYQGSLEGRFVTNTSYTTPIKDTATLKVTNIASNSEVVRLNWQEDEVDTLGKWKVSTSQAMSIDGFAFHIGPVSAIGVSDNFISNFFQNCTLEISKSNQVVESYPSSSCVNAYFGVDLEPNQTYTISLTASPIESAREDFIDNGHNGKQVALSIIAVTPANGVQVKYNDSIFNNLISQKESSSGTEYGKTLTFEYTYGTYSLINNLFEDEDEEKVFSISQNAQPITIEQKEWDATNSTSFVQSTTQNVDLTEQNVKIQTKKSFTLSIEDVSSIDKELTLTVTENGSSIKVSDGTSTKYCSVTGTGTYSCQIP